MTLRKLTDAAVVADSLNIPKWRVYELAREGVIPHVRLGRSMRFDEVRIREWLDAGGSDRREPYEDERPHRIYETLYRDAEKEIAQLRATIEVLRGELQVRLLEEGVTEEELAAKMERFGRPLVHRNPCP